MEKVPNQRARGYGVRGKRKNRPSLATRRARARKREAEELGKTAAKASAAAEAGATAEAKIDRATKRRRIFREDQTQEQSQTPDEEEEWKGLEDGDEPIGYDDQLPLQGDYSEDESRNRGDAQE